MLDKLYTGLKDISEFTVIVIIFVFIWALLGMELFAYLVTVDLNGDYISQTDAQ